MKSDIPIHPDILGRYVAEVCDEELSGDVIAILDAFTGSSFFTDWFKAKFPAQVLDSSEMMGIGHGIGMSIGAGLATERRYPIIAFMGDTGFLAYMGDVETALRWEIPVVYIVNNNSGTAIAGWKPFYSKQMSPTGRWEWDSFGFTKDMPFHSMFAPLPGMHTELVERPDEIKPALKRALKHVREKSKPAVVNVIVDAEVLMDGWAAWFCVCHTHQPWEDIPDEGKRWFLSGLGLGPNGLELYYPEVAAKKDEWMKKLGMK